MKTAEAVDLRCEYQANPLGLGEVRPRLSWRIQDPRPGACQTAYRLLAASRPDRLAPGRADLWDSGKVADDACLDIVYPGAPLASRQAVFWRVCVWDRRGAASPWSERAFFSLGLLKPADWTARWIGRAPARPAEEPPCPFLRRAFELQASVSRALLYVTARGLFDVWLNGRRVGKDYFTPGWTDYAKRIQVAAYDVTRLLRKGANVAGAILAEGWFAGRLGWERRRGAAAGELSLLLQLEVEHPDGSRTRVVSGPDWQAAAGPLKKASLYDGETYDARDERPGWCVPGGDAGAGWRPVRVVPPPRVRLVAWCSPPVRRQETLRARKLTEPAPGVYVFDLGQNMAGWARIRVRAGAGRTVAVRHAEMLNPDGTLYTENLRTAQCTDRYTARGGGTETYEPRFTFHGFRYVELTGLAARPRLGDAAGVVLHSDLPATGEFACSDARINRLQHAIAWGQKGNFLEVPTDCPQRDERLGWTGDAQVFIRTASFNRDVAAFFTKWCRDLEDAQTPEGAFPHVAPNVLRPADSGCAAWGDAGVICPWQIYLSYGDTRILERRYASMVRWIEWRRRTSPGLLCSSACFGDARMNSFNHYAYGAVGEWLYETVAGIRPDPAQPGYKRIVFQPEPGGGLPWARGALNTRYGRAACAWTLKGRTLRVTVVVPANTRATVVLPGRRPAPAQAGTHVYAVRLPRPWPPSSSGLRGMGGNPCGSF